MSLLTDDIDITDLVEKMRIMFVSLETEASFVALSSVAGLQWLQLPIISSIVKKLIEIILNGLSKRTVQQAFFLNTALRKTSQAKDFVDAVNNLEESHDESDEIYEQLELAKIAAFNKLVRVTM